MASLPPTASSRRGRRTDASLDERWQRFAEASRQPHGFGRAGVKGQRGPRLTSHENTNEFKKRSTKKSTLGIEAAAKCHSVALQNKTLHIIIIIIIIFIIFIFEVSLSDFG
ncbi:uncharacterized protein V6R79_007192 [Siganus canaliculatus]